MFGSSNEHLCRLKGCNNIFSKKGRQKFCSVKCRTRSYKGRYKYSIYTKIAGKTMIYKRNYNTTIEEVYNQWINQNKLCAYCHLPCDDPCIVSKRTKKNKTHIDHNHQTGSWCIVHNKCNIQIGKHTLGNIQILIDYLNFRDEKV